MENGNDVLMNKQNYINFNVLEKLCDDNFDYFKNDKTENGIQLKTIFKQLSNYVQSSKWKIEKIHEFAVEYDYDEHTPGNGYRSFIKIINLAIDNCLDICETIKLQRYRYFFRKQFYLNELTSYKELLLNLCTCLDYLFIIHEWSDKGCLFINTDKHNAVELFEYGEKIDQSCFYGRCAGFQYTDSMRYIMNGLGICMASYSQSYFSKANKLAKTTSSAWLSSKYLINPELKAKRIVTISHSANIDFCKSFWFLAESEIMHKLPSIFGTTIEINNVINIPPEPLQLDNVETGELVNIPIPKSHLSSKSIPVRLLSSYLREGMIGILANNKKSKPQPVSDYLLIHCHGGGFVAQSSKSHELYLRNWAVHLNAPILSIDYSLAPEAPYPRALEEVFYTYCWALKNAKLLGTTARKVVLAGDSAGANLCIATTFKCIDFGLRKPDGLFIAYCPVYIDFIPSPARMLCLMDPLLPFGFMIRCMKAYACIDETATEATQINDDNITITKEGHISTNHNIVVESSKENENDLRRVSTISNTPNDDESKTNKSIASDVTSDTFASASYHHSQNAGNTDLLTPDIPSSCISLEDDSQPIMKLSAETLSNISTPPIDDDSINDDKNQTTNTTTFLKEHNSSSQQNTIIKSPSVNNVVANTLDTELSNVKSLHGRLQQATTSLIEIISSTLKSFTLSSEINSEENSLNLLQDVQSADSNENKISNLDVLIARNPGSELGFKVPKDIYISPFLASDEYLRQMPPTSILTIDMDPCLDDSVMFAKRLRKVGNKVKIDILEGLPHGFLNFTMLSKEASDGSRICAERIADLFSDGDNNK